MSKDVKKAVNPVIVYLWFILWIWLGSFIFRNVFVGVIGNGQGHCFELFVHLTSYRFSTYSRKNERTKGGVCETEEISTYEKKIES
jgi:hypothetical protein